jgi:hypothetical protein
MAGPRFGGYAGVGDSERAGFEDFGAEEGRERSGCACIVREGRGIRIWVCLEAFVGAETVAFILSVIAVVIYGSRTNNKY